MSGVPQVTIRADPPPEPGGIVSVIAILCLLLIVLVVLRRLLRGRRGRSTLFAFSIGVGNALFEMGAMLQPHRANIESIAKAESPGENAAHDQGVGDGRRSRGLDGRPDATVPWPDD